MIRIDSLSLRPLWALLFLLLIGGIRFVGAQNANKLMEEAVSTYENEGGFVATFSIQINGIQQNVSEKMDGTIRMQKEKFSIDTPDATIWFDGETQWNLFKQNEEVNVSTPTTDELMMSNPMTFLQHYKKGFKASYEGERTAMGGKTAYEVVLTPKVKVDIASMVLLLDKFSKLPLSIELILRNGMINKIQIKSMEKRVQLPDNSFTFDEAAFPNVEVIDLR